MVRVSVHEAKANLSAILKRAEQGETIVVTRHDKPIAELRPFEKHKANEDVKRRLAVLDEFLGSVGAPQGFDARRIRREDLYE